MQEDDNPLSATAGKQRKKSAASLRKTFSLAFVLVSVLPLLFSIIVTFEQSERTTVQAVFEANRNLAANIADDIDAIFIEKVRLLKIVANNAEIKSADPLRQTAVLRDLYFHSGDIGIALLADSQGKLIARSDDQPIAGISYFDRDYFQQMLRTRTTAISGVIQSRSTGHQVIGLAEPVIGWNGELLGAVIINVELEKLGQRIAKTKIGQTGYAILINEDGHILQHPESGIVATAANLFRMVPELSTVFKQTGAMEYEYEGQKKLAGYSYAPTPGWGLIVQQPLDEALAGVRATRRANLFIVLLAGVGAIAFGLILAGRLSRPITDISEAAAGLAAGDLSVRLDVARRDELGRLADAFNDMALQLQKREEALMDSEQRYRSLVDNLKIGVYRSLAEPPGRFIQANPAMASIFGFDSVAEFLQQDVETLFQKTGDRAAFLAKLAKQGTLTDEELALRKKDGTPIWCTYNITAHYDEQGRIEWIEGVMENITEKKMRQRWQAALYQLSAEISHAGSLEELFKTLHKVIREFMPANRFFVALQDESGNLAIVYAASAIGEFSIFEAIPAGLMEAVFRSGEPQFGNDTDWRTHGSEHLAVPLRTGDGRVLGVMGLAGGDDEVLFAQHHLAMLDFWSGQIAATIERKNAENHLRFVSLHDALTKLYNRNYFEEEMKRLDRRRSGAVALVVFDLDGLKMVNDTLGHEQGDRMLVVAAQSLRSAFRDGDVVARIGGDEFAALLEDASEELLGQIRERIRQSTELANRQQPDEVALPISLSMGYALSVGSGTPMRELFRQADNSMYREKLNRGQSARNSIVQTVMNMLKARDFITENHSDRLQLLVTKLAERRGLSPERIADLCLLAQFHDIGKVGIPDRILMKPGLLNADEMAEMQKHCEIGHRISLALPELEAISEWILKHHEWWNGAGYPLGIAGAKIPLECRILAIADAYDAMTNDRPYRPAMSHQAAITELIHCAGTQFDPELVRLFTGIELTEIGLDSSQANR